MTQHGEAPDGRGGAAPDGQDGVAPDREGLDARRGWMSRTVLPGGEEPDPRFTLANERTFLAWIRTSMALLAGGIAIEAFAVDLFEVPVRKSVALLLIGLGMFVSAGAFLRWIGVERAIRHQAPLPLPLIAPVLGLGGAVGALTVAYFIVFR